MATELKTGEWTASGAGLSAEAVFISTSGSSLETGNLYYVDTTSSEIALTLPTTDIEDGSIVDLQDHKSNWSVNNVVLSAEDGSVIDYDETTYTLDISDMTVQCVYNSGFWEVHSTGYSGSTGLEVPHAYAILVDTNTSNNALTTTSEVADLDAIYNAENVSLYTSSDYISIDNDFVTFVKFDQEYNVYRDDSSESATSYDRLMWKLFYSDDSGSSWYSNTYWSGILRVPENMSRSSQYATITVPHVAGRVYQLRRATNDTSLYLLSYTASEDTITSANGTSYSVPRYPMKVTVMGW